MLINSHIGPIEFLENEGIFLVLVILIEFTWVFPIPITVTNMSMVIQKGRLLITTNIRYRTGSS